MRKIFISVGCLIRALKLGTVETHELDSALFYFEDGKEHFFATLRVRVLEWFSATGSAAASELSETIVDALEKAEHEGRLTWPRSGDGTFPEFNQLLVKNGFGSIPTTHVHGGRVHVSSYGYSAARERVQQAKMQIEVCV